MSVKNSLLPCPFCGETPEQFNGTGYITVACVNMDCGICPSIDEENAPGAEAKVFVAWNTRATNGLPEAIAALERVQFDMRRIGNLPPDTIDMITAALTKLKG